MHGCAVAQRALCELLGRFGALRVITHVMTAASIGASRGGGYARYLESKTVEPERGDYYLTPDGEMAPPAAGWPTPRPWRGSEFIPASRWTARTSSR
jgi:hypothetical protein